MGSDNGLVPSGNKPLPNQMLTQIYDNISFNKATINQPRFKGSFQVSTSFNPAIFVSL